MMLATYWRRYHPIRSHRRLRVGGLRRRARLAGERRLIPRRKLAVGGDEVARMGPKTRRLRADGNL